MFSPYLNISMSFVIICYVHILPIKKFLDFPFLLYLSPQYLHLSTMARLTLSAHSPAPSSSLASRQEYLSLRSLGTRMELLSTSPTPTWRSCSLAPSGSVAWRSKILECIDVWQSTKQAMIIRCSRCGYTVSFAFHLSNHETGIIVECDCEMKEAQRVFF